ncbi:hypothetical protein [Natrinema caseinilyticum]|uniref:hypothetical protein n=1 Tax=Natrinema caseinilyticum TaxID=2961570 RepID=UPI0020C38D62|nr:hypothetical protein [Natrinema caseinilyticum]
MRVNRTVAAALVALSLWPSIVSAHGVETHAGSQIPGVPFVVAIGASALLGVAFGLGSVSHYRTSSAVADHHGATGPEVVVLVIVLGVAAFTTALTQGWIPAVGGGAFGAALALAGRTRGVSPHAGCADAALGAVLTHRVVEGILVASIYATNASIGLFALALLTVHAIAETVAVGGLYAPVSRSWGIASVVAVQVGFVAGAVVGATLVGGLSPPIVTILLASVGGVLFVAGATEFHVAAIRRRKRLEA